MHGPGSFGLYPLTRCHNLSIRENQKIQTQLDLRDLEILQFNPLDPKVSKRRNFFVIFCMCATFGLT